MKSKYTFWIFIGFLTLFILWWYYYAFTNLNTTRYEEDTDTGSSVSEREPPPGVEIKNPEPKEVGEALTEPITYRINASSLEEWAYFDFSMGAIVKEPEHSSLEWDLGFKRALIISNG